LAQVRESSADRTQAIVATRTQVPYPTVVHYWPGEGHVLSDPAHLDAFARSLSDFFAQYLSEQP
jgi:hypothetical protein